MKNIFDINQFTYMKIRSFALFLAALFCSSIAFSQTADMQKGCAPLEVNFTPPGGGSHFWSFGNGNQSSDANPSAVYGTPGMYTVEYSNSQGGPVIGTIDIEVFAKPVVAIESDPASGCRPLSVQFSELVQNDPQIVVSNYEWTFGDGTNVGNGATTSHVYVIPGNFTVSLAITTNFPSCNLTEVFLDEIEVSNAPQVAISTSPNPPSACDPPLTVDFGMAVSGGVAPLSFAWDFANGSTSNAQMPPAQTFTAAGIYPVTLVVTDAIGCSITADRIVSIGNPMIDISLPDTICLGEEYTIDNNSSAGSLTWDIADGMFTGSSTNASLEPSIRFNTPGLKTISLNIVANGGCNNSGSIQVFVDDADASFVIDPAYSCTEPTSHTFTPNSNAGTSWLWTYNDGTTSTVENPTHVWTNPVTDNFGSLGQIFDTTFLRLTTASGCVDEQMGIAEIWRPNAKFMPDVQQGCAPLNVIFSDSSISNETIVQWTYIWDDGTANTIVTNDNDVPHTFTQAGDYNVILIIENAAGCIDTSYQVLIEVGSPITGDFVADVTDICPGDTVRFETLTMDPNIDAYHFSSESDKLWHCFDVPNPFWVYDDETGPLDVSLTLEYNGCFNTVTKEDYINVKGPIAKAHYRTTCDSSYRFEFISHSSGADSSRWFIEGDSITSDSFVYHFTTSGEKVIILKAINLTSGCADSYDTFSVFPTNLMSDFELMDTLCGGTPLNLDGSMATDVNAVCYKGYTWYFSFQRPIRTDMVVTEIAVPTTGMHSIALEVEDINGCQDTLEKEFVAIELTPDFAMSETVICNPDTVMFTDLTYAEYWDGIDTWEWSFGDGSMSTDTNPTHIYTLPPLGGASNYEITLKVTDKFGCPQEITKNLSWYIPETTISSLAPPQLCVGDELDFIATDFTSQGSNLEWVWDFEGNIQTGQNATYTFNTSGINELYVNITEIASGCMNRDTFEVDVQDYPTAEITASEDLNGIICAPTNMIFTNSSVSVTPTTASWDFGNGVSSVGNQVSTVYPKGTYTVNMTATTSYGCSDSAMETFDVVGPEGDFTMDKIIICTGDEVTFEAINLVDISSYTWDFGDGTTLDDVVNPTHTFTSRPASNILTVQLILRGQNDACTVVLEKTLNFSPIKADFATQNPTVCVGSDHVFLDNSISADVYSWDFGDGSTSTSANASHPYTAAGTYDVTLIVTDEPLGCMDTITASVEVAEDLQVEAFGAMICPGDVATIGVNSPVGAGFTYSWTPTASITPPATGASVSASPNVTTDYTVVVSDVIGCTGSQTVNVFVPTLGQVTTNFDTTIACGVPVNLPILYQPDLYNYLLDSMPVNNANDFMFAAVEKSDTFLISITDVMGCISGEFTHIIEVVPAEVVYPNAFTPDGDGSNDVFRLITKTSPELVDVEYFQIFNRWGNLVFEDSGTVQSVGWDGMDNGKLGASDVYVWRAKVRFRTGAEEELHGQVQLLR